MNSRSQAVLTERRPHDLSEVTLAPYALVRIAVAQYPQSPESNEYRRILDRLVTLEAYCRTIAPSLCDALYASAAEHSADFHRAVVLSLRRSIHNGRSPKESLVDRIADLPLRVPELAKWLAARQEMNALEGELLRTEPIALQADRQALARLCAEPSFQKAIALTSADLLSAVRRTADAAGAVDHRLRKAEPNVLRYALRATTKTSPRSWFTPVAWGTWAAPGSDATEPDRDQAGSAIATARAVSRPNRVLVDTLIDHLIGLPDTRRLIPHRLAPGLRVSGQRLQYRRDLLAGNPGKVLNASEDEIELPLTPPIRLLVQAARAAGPEGVTHRQLVDLLAGKLPTAGREALANFVDQLLDQRLFVPCFPVEPQSPNILPGLLEWLELKNCGPAGLPPLLRDVQGNSIAFADLSAPQRPAAIQRLSALWAEVFTTVDSPLPVADPVTEDVAIPGGVRLGAVHGREALPSIAGIAPVLELFDNLYVIRRLLRDWFVGRYGPGGRCRHLAEPSAEFATIVQESRRVSLSGEVERPDSLSPELRRLAEVRAQVLTAVQAEWSGGPELVIPNAVVADATAAVPAWMRSRPTSYSLFVQPFREDGRDRLCLNHVYGGWGRYTSRFLDLLGPSATEAVASMVRAHRTPGSRQAQFRPLQGFNANLHPLVVDDEVAEDPAWATIVSETIELFHDLDSDQLRLRVAETGECLDVLYLGFLIPYLFPDRTAFLYSDLGNGPATLAPLAPQRERTEQGVSLRESPRLRYGDLVLHRREWQLSADQVLSWAAELDDTGAGSWVRRWRAAFGLPEDLFLREGISAGDITTAEDAMRYSTGTKPQFVDLGSPLHLRCLRRWLRRISTSLVISEALPSPSRNSSGRVVELIVETYRRAEQTAAQEGDRP